MPKIYQNYRNSLWNLEIIYQLRDKDISSSSIKHFFEKPVTDGGFWNIAINLVEKYGIIPKSTMRETLQSNNTKQMNFFINMNYKH